MDFLYARRILCDFAEWLTNSFLDDLLFLFLVWPLGSFIQVACVIISMWMLIRQISFSSCLSSVVCLGHQSLPSSSFGFFGFSYSPYVYLYQLLVFITWSLSLIRSLCYLFSICNFCFVVPFYFFYSSLSFCHSSFLPSFLPSPTPLCHRPPTTQPKVIVSVGKINSRK